VVDAGETFVAFGGAFGGGEGLGSGAGAAVCYGEDVLMEEGGKVFWKSFVFPIIKPLLSWCMYHS
jgi:hypothetical protein